MIKFEFDLCGDAVWNSDYAVTIEAPNMNVALMNLALSHDLTRVRTIYTKTNEDDEDDD